MSEAAYKGEELKGLGVRMEKGLGFSAWEEDDDEVISSSSKGKLFCMELYIQPNYPSTVRTKTFLKCKI